MKNAGVFVEAVVDFVVECVLNLVKDSVVDLVADSVEDPVADFVEDFVAEPAADSVGVDPSIIQMSPLTIHHTKMTSFLINLLRKMKAKTSTDMIDIDPQSERISTIINIEPFLNFQMVILNGQTSVKSVLTPKNTNRTYTIPQSKTSSPMLKSSLYSSTLEQSSPCLEDQIRKIRGGAKPNDKRDQIKGFRLAQVYFNHAKYNDAKNWCLEYQKLFPRDQNCNHLLAKVYAKLKMPKHTKASYEDTIRNSSGNSTTADIVLEYANYLYKLDEPGSFDKIIELLNQASSFDASKSTQTEIFRLYCSLESETKAINSRFESILNDDEQNWCISEIYLRNQSDPKIINKEINRCLSLGCRSKSWLETAISVSHGDMKKDLILYLPISKSSFKDRILPLLKGKIDQEIHDHALFAICLLVLVKFKKYLPLTVIFKSFF